MKQKSSDIRWLKYVISLSQQSPSSDTAFAVGVAIIDAKGNLLADGFSREISPSIHAEEVALQKVSLLDVDLGTCTLYSSLEPCKKRLSEQIGCADRIITNGIKRVVFASLEPPLFVTGHGRDSLREAQITVVLMSEFTSEVIAQQSPVIQKMWQKMLS